MNNKKEIVGITLDKKTKKKIDKYGDDHSLSRSAAIRFICNDFFLRLGGKA